MRLFRCTFLISLLLSAPALPSELAGRVVSIADGDTFTLLTADKQQIRIRLAEIDTPESGQPYGNRARQALAGLVFQKDVRVEVQTTDRYGRTVGRPYVGDVDVCAELVENGFAWAYRRYLRDPKLLDLEQDAKDSKRGLWALPEYERVAPWDWRRGKRTPSAVPDPASGFTCGTKTYCRDMTSCEEARFYLRSCGLSRLDGDNDGTPCEVLCE
jgi:endonuclease YncB( thermonuclease family)